MSPTGDQLGTLELHLQELLGCCWGRKLSDPDDQDPCQEKAVRIMVLHNPNGDDEMAFKFCEHHAARVYSLTDPHQGET